MRGSVSGAGGGATARLAVDEDRHEALCFSDDISIDFPSVVPAVTRMRRPFDVVSVPIVNRRSLWLTRGQARVGIVVPLDVDVPAICRACGGRGESWTEPCRRCHGVGSEAVPHQVQVRLPSGVRDGTRFTFTLTPRHQPGTRVELRVCIA